MKNKTRWYSILAIVLALLLVSSFIGCGQSPKEEIEEKAYNNVIKELQANGNPIGMFGATWYMTQQEVKSLNKDLQQIDANTLIEARRLYDRSIQTTYHFENDRLLLIVASFADTFDSLEGFSDAFYTVQNRLSLDYGQMPEPIMHELIPPTDDKWTDQDFLESEKKMGRIHLVHKIRIQSNSAGEQILMYLSEKGK